MGYKWKTDTCSTCEGTGKVDAESECCGNCGGTGRVHSFWHNGSAICRHCVDGWVPMERECPSCRGKGSVTFEVMTCIKCGKEDEDCRCYDDYAKSDD